ncbi:S1 family peptidase [Spirosoma aerolatum]|uniref:S1 family peptidase n=1 Tax=Spirosoma aerolatum TaxID=1211326 RepID=UPI0009AC135F|nr:serine protease [Spirosoma aerolatum]
MRDNELTAILKEYTVRIETKTSGGTGFFIAPNMIITCLHVIDIPYEVYWKDRKINTTIAVSTEKYIDLCILKVEEDIYNTCVMIGSLNSIGDTLYSYGYPEDYRTGDSLSVEYEGYSSTGYKNYQLIKLKRGQIKPGFSGAPLLNLRTGLVCGMIKTTRNKAIDLGGRAICLNEIQENVNELDFVFQKNNEFNKYNRKWYNMLTDNQKKEIGIYKIYIQEKDISIENLISNSKERMESICSNFISGSNLVRLADLIKSDFTLNFKTVIIENKKKKEVEFINYCIERITDAASLSKIQHQKFVILGDPGFGKSTLLYKLYYDLLQKLYNEEIGFIPIHIDLHDYADDQSFGTKEWTYKYLDSITENENVTWSIMPNKKSIYNLTLFPYFILDSLDEYLADCTPSEVNSRLGKYIFGLANIISCRTRYFDTYLAMSNFSSQFEKCYLSNWEEKYTIEYTKWFLERIGYEVISNLNAYNIFEIIQKSENLKEICKVPLRYNMTLETLSSSFMNFDLVESLNSLYDNYIYGWLSREASRVGNILSIEDKIYSLEIISWEFYEEGQIGNDIQKNSFSLPEMRSFLENDKYLKKKYNYRKDITSDLALRSILSIQRIELNQILLKFTHKSFQEFFVAKYIYSLMRNSSAKLATCLRQHISQEVEQFLKEFISNINTNIRFLTSTTEIFIEAYNMSSEKRGDSNIEKSRKRLARSQLAYNMGHLKGKNAYDFLVEQLLYREKDEFIKRSIIIGLAFGGNDQFLNDYVDMLRNETNSRLNDINVGSQLTYFGDQPFEVLYPEKDQGLRKCRGTVSKLLLQLDNKKNNAASWRLDLYTIIYIGKYRSQSSEDFSEVFKEKIYLFNAIIEKFKSEQIEWPEIFDSEELIKKYKFI